MKRKQHPVIDFKQNLILYYIAVGIILLGYLFLSIGDANSFTSITMGPVIIVIGYLIAVPFALLTGTPCDTKEKSEEKQ